MDEFAAVEEAAVAKWPHIKVFNTICNATTKRQTAILDLAPQVDMVLVVGSTSSAKVSVDAFMVAAMVSIPVGPPPQTRISVFR